MSATGVSPETASRACLVGSPGGAPGRPVGGLPRGLRGGRPRAAAPAVAAQPPARLDPRNGRGHTGESVVEGGRGFETNFALDERPRREVHMRVREAREDAAADEVDPLRARKRG